MEAVADLVADLYGRLSRWLPDQTSTQRQVDQARNKADVNGYTVGEVHVDTDRSAYDTKIHREGYQRLKERIVNEEIQAVIVWKIDRLGRNLMEFMRFVELCDDHGVSIISVTEPFDTSSPMGRAIVQMLAVWAELESATIALRTKAGKKTAAANGKYSGGGNRGFGYTVDRSEVIPEEAVEIKLAAERRLAGESWRTIVSDWDERGIRTPLQYDRDGAVKGGGNPWNVSTLSAMIISPHIAGLRLHKPRKGRYERVAAKMTISEASWPAIIDRATHEALVLDRKASSRPAARRVSFLTGGILRCGHCQVSMISSRGRTNERIYRCNPNRSGCGRISIAAERVEKYVEEMMLGLLTTPEVADSFRAIGASHEISNEVLNALALKRREQTELGESYAHGNISLAVLEAADNALTAEIRRLEERANNLARQRVGTTVVSDDPVGDWHGRDLSGKAALVQAFFESIVVLSAPAGARWSPVENRLSLTPRSAGG